MIGFLRGLVVEKQPTRILLDVRGVGYELSVPVSTSERLAPENGEVTLLTYLHVREDAMQLYGFSTQEEKKLFQDLLSVSGVGPRVALGIISGCRVDEFYSSIRQADIRRLTNLPGIGKKTAERLVLELKDKIKETGAAEAPAPAPGKEARITEALLALQSLGYNRTNAEKVLQQIAAGQTEVSTEALVKEALRRL